MTLAADTNQSLSLSWSWHNDSMERVAMEAGMEAEWKGGVSKQEYGSMGKQQGEKFPKGRKPPLRDVRQNENVY